MTKEWIVCFAKDWSEEPTSNNHVMVEMAKYGPVLWLNSVSTRTPKLTSGRDLKKIFRKLASFFRGARQVGENMWVYTPIVLPLPHSKWAKAINRRILRTALRFLRWRLRFKEFQLWTFLPNVTDYVGTLGESMVVYYCVDEWSKFNYVEGGAIADAEQQLCRQADIVFATARSLVKKRLEWNSETHLALHGVDHELFAQALMPAMQVPQDIRDLPKPVIGFYGTLQDWVDLKLITFLAQRHPEWSIILIGKPMVDLSPLSPYKNVHVLGARPHNQLPGYCKAFSVGIIPYVINERILHVNPIKLREYLCAGLPVVSVSIPEVQGHAGLCAVAENYEEFEAAIIEALKTDNAGEHVRRSEAMKSETWQQRVVAIRDQVARVKESKCHKQ